MARWKKLLLASALLVWPVVCSAQGMGDSTSTGMAPMSKGRPGLFDTGSSRMTASESPAVMRTVGPAATTTGASSTASPSISGMPVTEGIVPAGGCGPAPCAPGCDMGAANWGVSSMATDGPSGFVVMGELLWLKMRRNDPVVLTQNIAGNTTTGDLVDYDTEYSVGFRAGGGYLARSGWLFTAMYTRYKDNSIGQTFTANAPGGEQSILYVGPGVFASDIQFSEGRLNVGWEFDYQTLDLMVGSVISPSSCLDIIVNGGVRLGNLSQTYTTNAEITPAVPTVLRETLDMSLRGAGPRIGTEARLYLLSHLMLYGRGYSSLLLASREENSFSTVDDFGGTASQFFTYTREEIVPMVELGAGVEVSFFEGQFLLGFGYEWNYIFEGGSSNVDFASNARFNRHVNVTLDGFALRAGFLW